MKDAASSRHVGKAAETIIVRCIVGEKDEGVCSVCLLSFLKSDSSLLKSN